jgi:RHS repeat-associated protein
LSNLQKELCTSELDGATTAAVGITYDELSRRAVLTYANGVTSTYTFQLNNDLTTLAEAFVGSAVTLTYGFNKVHQETSRAVTDGTYLWHPGAGGTTTYAAANTINEYPTVGGASYQYDGNGNLKSDGTWTYVYDTENHLLSASKTGVSASYVYDGLHRQIQKTISSTSTRYYYGGWQRLADYNGTTLQNRYVYGTGLDEALIEVSGAGVLTYLHADRLGSVVATTNSAGAVVNKTAYGPSGEGSPPSGISFGFTGQRYDNETGLCYYKRRLYSPSIGRFLQPDPLGNAAGLNLYLYNWSDPLNHTDIYGLEGGPIDLYSKPVARVGRHTSIIQVDPLGIGDYDQYRIWAGGPDSANPFNSTLMPYEGQNEARDLLDQLQNDSKVPIFDKCGCLPKKLDDAVQKYLENPQPYFFVPELVWGSRNSNSYTSGLQGYTGNGVVAPPPGYTPGYGLPVNFGR